MSIALFLKNNLNNIPPSVGSIINKIPYSIRPGIGNTYRKRKNEINEFEKFTNSQKKLYFFDRVNLITQYAYNLIPFYKDFYIRHSFNPSMLKSFDDIQRIPIVNKMILEEYDLERRSHKTRARYTVNTGGSSGTPFSLYIEPSSMGHEWAHMHHIWEKLGYRPANFKLVFGGRSDIKGLVEYDVVRNSFFVDVYADYKEVSRKLKSILRKYSIKYLHGYPSAIYDFSIFCEMEDPELGDLLARNLKGAFLGSEYPHKLYRENIEDVFDIKSISWYGHTERSVLAYEKKEKFTYEPFGTYGFSEAISQNNQNCSLIATSYYNFASPLIRYDTNDIVSDVETIDGVLNSFKLTKGREGEFVLDNNKKKINLTGLIFGRHHEIFNHSKFIQVKQIEVGKIEIHFVSNSLSEKGASELFDKRNLNMSIDFVKRDEPYRTGSGKVNLLIRNT